MPSVPLLGEHHISTAISFSRTKFGAQDSDTTVRERTAVSLTLIARKTHGVKKVLQCGALPTLLDLLQDPNIPVRYLVICCKCVMWLVS